MRCACLQTSGSNVHSTIPAWSPGQEYPALRHCERQDFCIRHGAIRLSGIQRGGDVMPQSPQYGLCGLVLANLRLDFLSVGARVGPSVHQIFGAQMRVGSQQGLLAGAQTPGSLEQPNGNASSNDTRFTSANVRPRVYARKIVIKVPNHPLENLRLLPMRQWRQHLLKITQTRHSTRLAIVADARRLSHSGFPLLYRSRQKR